MKNDGGPAFPSTFGFVVCEKCNEVSTTHRTDGMTLRDWYKGKALELASICEMARILTMAMKGEP